MTLPTEVIPVIAARLGWTELEGSTPENPRYDPPLPGAVSPGRYNQCAKTGLQFVSKTLMELPDEHEIAAFLLTQQGPAMGPSAIIMMLAAALIALRKKEEVPHVD